MIAPETYVCAKTPQCPLEPGKRYKVLSVYLREDYSAFVFVEGYPLPIEASTLKAVEESLSFTTDIDWFSDGSPFLRLTRDGFCHYESLGYVEAKIIYALNLAKDEEIIVTFTKQKKRL